MMIISSEWEDTVDEEEAEGREEEQGQNAGNSYWFKIQRFDNAKKHQHHEHSICVKELEKK